MAGQAQKELFFFVLCSCFPKFAQKVPTSDRPHHHHIVHDNLFFQNLVDATSSKDLAAVPGSWRGLCLQIRIRSAVERMVRRAPPCDVELRCISPASTLSWRFPSISCVQEAPVSRGLKQSWCFSVQADDAFAVHRVVDVAACASVTQRLKLHASFFVSPVYNSAKFRVLPSPRISNGNRSDGQKGGTAFLVRGWLH